MRLRRLSLLLLAVCCITPDSWGVRPTGYVPASASGRYACDVGRAANLPPSGLRQSSISPYALWRYRLKSVLQESDSRLVRETDLGPVPLPEPAFLSVAQTPGNNPFRAIVPLRC